MLLRATQSSLVVLVCLLVLAGRVSTQTVSALPSSAAPIIASELVASSQPSRVFPRLHMLTGLDLTYLGMFSPDAKYRATSRMAALTGNSPGEGIPPAGSKTQPSQADNVPKFMLTPLERVVDDFNGPTHLQASARPQTRAAETRNHFLNSAYGHPSVIQSPRHITTDSQRRLVVSDPDGAAIHVLDPRGSDSFRIVTGPDRHVRKPEGIAVDSADNIYVADSDRGMIAVFDPHGRFLHYIGTVHGEPDYAGPHGLAIDLKAGRIYVSDSPRNLVVVLDLQGKVLKRLGRLHGGSGVGEFDGPTDIAVNHQHVFILDHAGTRVQVMDMSANLVGSFNVTRGLDLNLNSETGLGADQAGNVYISWPNISRIWVYSYDGRLVCAFGQRGTRVGEFVGPGGLWIDSTNRLYVADSGNGRVQLFQLASRH